MRETRPIARHAIRGIELDASRFVSPGWLSRIFEDARWRVFALGGYLRGVMTGGVVRAGTYAYGVPLGFGEDVDVATWVARVGRTSFDLGHRMVRARDGAVAASARVTIVNLGPNGPTPVDPIVREYVVDDPAPAVRPFSGPDRTDSWSHEWVVRPSDLDSFQHVNQARYVDYIDDTRWLAAQASAPAGLRGRLDGLTVEYVREAHAGDSVWMETWPTSGGARAYELRRRRDGELLMRGQAFASGC